MPFSRLPRFDRVKVAELVEVARRQLLRIERESREGWEVPAEREDWDDSRSAKM